MRSSFFMRSSSLAIARYSASLRKAHSYAPGRSVAGGESRAQIGLSVHSAAPTAFLAPMLSRSRSVVERSAPMPFSSCPVERNPRVERGSNNIARSVLYLAPLSKYGEHSHPPRIEGKTLSEVLPVGRRDN